MANPLATFSTIGPHGGLSFATMVAGSGTTLTSLNDGPTLVMGGSLGNVNGTVRFLKLFDVSLAQVQAVNNGSPLAGASAVAAFIIPGNANGAGSNFIATGGQDNGGLQFTNGLAAEFTANMALADHSGIQVGDCIATIWYVP